MGNAAINVQVELTQISCGVCGAVYAINERYREKKEEDGGAWHCPYCQTGWGYTGTGENARLKKQLKEMEERKNRALAEANTLRANLLAEQARASKLKKRIGNGVCPCCTRSFTNLKRHLKSKHPDYSNEKSTGTAG